MSAVKGVWQRRGALFLATAVTGLVLGGCGGTETPAICSEVDDLQASVGKLSEVELAPGALTTLQDSLTKVQSDLRAVVSGAEEEYDTEIAALEEATSSLGASLEAAVSAPSAQTVAAVGTALEALGTSLTSLQDAVTSTC